MGRLRACLLAATLLGSAEGRWWEELKSRRWALPHKLLHNHYRQPQDFYVYHRPPPEGWPHWLRYAQERKCALGAYDKLEEDLRPFRDPTHSTRRSIPYRSVQKATALERTCVFRVREGAVSYWSAVPEAVAFSQAEERCGQLLNLFQGFAGHLPDMEFAVNAHDHARVLPGAGSVAERVRQNCHGARQEFQETWSMHGFFISPPIHPPENELLPLFSSTSIDGCFRDIVTPPPQNLALQPHPTAAQDYPWGERDPRLYFRGTSTGCVYNEETYDSFMGCHRQRLVAAARNDTRMDIGLTEHLQCTPPICARMQEVLPTVPRQADSENHRHKFVVSIDGNSYSSRLQTALSTGSLIFRAGLFSEWYEDRLLPYEHYLPVRFDFSDLGTQLDWALAHDAEAQAIAARAGVLARHYLRPEDAACYWFRALLEYAALVDWEGSEARGGEQA